MLINTLIHRAAIIAALVGLTAGGVGNSTRAAPSNSNLTNTQAATVSRLQTYLNGLSTLRANFMQVAPDGSLSQGVLYLARPGGRIRLEYEPPSQLLVVGRDGWITLRDKASDEDSSWPVGGTPFEVLIADRVDLAQDVTVRRVHEAGGVIRLTVEGRKDPDAGSLTLIFSESPLELYQWQVLDAQYLLTTVTLGDLHYNVTLDSALFVDQDPTLWGDEDDG